MVTGGKELRKSVPPIVLSIAGSDSGGGAGIQADLKTFAAWRCFGTTAIVAITAQNTLGVRAVHPVPLDIISAQLDALAQDLPPAATKTGMLATREVVDMVARTLVTRRFGRYVLDPVMVATSGDRLLDSDAIGAVRDHLIPLADLVTPNLDEAELLTGMTVRNPEEMRAAAHILVELGATAALIKGGHLKSDILVDVLVTRDEEWRFTRPRIATRATHGTGCTLSAAITAGLAYGNGIHDAVSAALNYLQLAINSAPGLGAGNGPLWHGVTPP
jgi:hydroxymethylpyrimidine/phosphomethylpyrimidine kinase